MNVSTQPHSTAHNEIVQQFVRKKVDTFVEFNFTRTQNEVAVLTNKVLCVAFFLEDYRWSVGPRENYWPIFLIS